MNDPRYKVTDLDDPEFSFMIFDHIHEVQDWITQEVDRRVQFLVDHCLYDVTEEEREDLEKLEHSSLKITEI